jgi:hypothetical protein
LWLLEELGIEYDLKLHKRVENRAPPDLSHTHPLGKSPQLVLADGRVLIESNCIAKYLISTYDTSNKFKGDGEKNDALRDDMLSDFVDSSMATNTIVGVLFLALAAKSPFFLRHLCGAMWKAMRAGYCKSLDSGKAARGLSSRVFHLYQMRTRLTGSCDCLQGMQMWLYSFNTCLRSSRARTISWANRLAAPISCSAGFMTISTSES